VNTRYEDLAALFRYPDDLYPELCRRAGLPGMADAMQARCTAEIQEMFIAAFDWNPSMALDLGWHLYGEQYARGEFLVTMRGELRRYGILESAELPDHLTHVLELMSRMDAVAGENFARHYAAPAVAKLLVAAESCKSPFSPAIRAVRDAMPVDVPLPPSRVELPVLVGED
jgi:nitrate reductase delta subunit